MITKAARPLSLRLLRNNSMACGQSDGAMIQADVLDTIQRSRQAAWQLDDAIDECYDDEISEKATMQIGRQIAKSILSRFDSF